MVLSMLLALTTCPAMLGTQEAIRQSQSKERREEHRARRCNLIASCVKSSIRSREINGRQVVLKDNKLYIDTGTAPEDIENETSNQNGHPFAGYFLAYPDSEHEGLVSTITDVAPILNWIYIDKDSYEVKYGVRADAQPNVTGPFDCTRLDRRMTLEGWEGFVAVEEYPAVWALYFDRDDNGLQGKVPFGTRVLELELSRKEKKVTVEGKREREREQEELRQQQQQQRQQQQQQDAAEAPLSQQSFDEDADDEEQRTDVLTEPMPPVPRVSVDKPDVEPQPPAEEGHHSEGQKGEEERQTGDFKYPFDETDFARLQISTDVDSASTEQAEGTVGTPTDPGCGASIWSAQEENSKSGRMDSVVSYATPDSSIQGDDEVAAAEAVYRQNDEVGAPPTPLLPKYKKPYVEEE